jgi:hypothetical protein
MRIDPDPDRPLSDTETELILAIRARDAQMLIEQLPTSLAAAAQHSARQAVEAMYDADADEGECLLRAGMAVEYLAKAHLARIHPVLVADGKQFDTVVTMVGHGHLLSAESTSLREVRTIGANEACKRVMRLTGGRWIYNDQRDGVVFSARNAVAHLAIYEDEALTAEVIGVMVRLLEGLLAAGGADEHEIEDFWGSTTGVVAAIREENRNLTSIRVEAKLAASRAVYAVRLPAGMSPEDRQTALHALQGRDLEIQELTKRRDCPACGERGFLVYLKVEGEVFGTGSGDSEEWHQAIEGHPVAFVCPVCDLDLEHDELGPVQLEALLHFDSVPADPD